MIISKEAIVAKSSVLQLHVDELIELVGTTIEVAVHGNLVTVVQFGGSFRRTWRGMA